MKTEQVHTCVCAYMRYEYGVLGTEYMSAYTTPYLLTEYSVLFHMCLPVFALSSESCQCNVQCTPSYAVGVWHSTRTEQRMNPRHPQPATRRLASCGGPKACSGRAPDVTGMNWLSALSSTDCQHTAVPVTLGCDWEICPGAALARSSPPCGATHV